MAVQLVPETFCSTANHQVLSSDKHSSKELKLFIEGALTQEITLNKEDVYVCENYTFYAPLNQDLSEEVKKQSNSIQTLIDMEPENKFALLTSITLLQHLHPGSSDSNEIILKRFDLLKTLDPLRLNYYKDSESKYKIETFIQTNPRANQIANLSSLQLTSIHHMHCFAHCKQVDLSNNPLTNNCLRHLTPLVACESLKLTHCSLSSLHVFPHLPSLESLDVSHNAIDHIEDSVFAKYEACVQVILTGNPVSADMVVKHCTLVV
ncbi:hypothetical protein M8J77_003714 [Diaphorina citri]|nr:hypothetical protein M8J77_003714 [Diaphorina citri]